MGFFSNMTALAFGSKMMQELARQGVNVPAALAPGLQDFAHFYKVKHPEATLDDLATILHAFNEILAELDAKGKRYNVEDMAKLIP